MLIDNIVLDSLYMCLSITLYLFLCAYQLHLTCFLVLISYIVLVSCGPLSELLHARINVAYIGMHVHFSPFITLLVITQFWL